MEIKRAWAVWSEYPGSGSWEIDSVHSTEVSANSVVENAPGCYELHEVVVAVDGDRCTILGKWEPVRFVQ